MMRRIFLLIILLCPFLFAGTANQHFMRLLKSRGTTPCATAGCTGTYDGCWTGDYSGDTDKICINSGASTADGTITGAVVSTDYGKTAGNSYGIRSDTQGDHIDWASTNIYVSSSGTVCAEIYVVSSSTINSIFQAYTDANDELRFYTEADGPNPTVVCRHNSGGTIVLNNDNSDTVTDQTWTIVCCSWDINDDCVDADDGCLSTWVAGGSGWVDDGDADPLLPFDSGEPTTVAIGEQNSLIGQDDIYIDNVYLWTSQKAYP